MLLNHTSSAFPSRIKTLRRERIIGHVHNEIILEAEKTPVSRTSANRWAGHRRGLPGSRCGPTEVWHTSTGCLSPGIISFYSVLNLDIGPIASYPWFSYHEYDTIAIIPWLPFSCWVPAEMDYRLLKDVKPLFNAGRFSGRNQPVR